MARRLVLALDEGTTGVTALVLDARLRVVGRAYREVACQFPRPGWVEQDATAVWSNTLAAAKAALRSAKATGADLAAIGVTNQRETSVLWDRRTGRPVAPAIVWQDRRTSARCAELRPEWEAKVRGRTGLVLDPYFSGTKLEWLLDRKGLRDRAKAGRLAFGTIDSWLAWNLTGAHVTDPTNASRTMLWDIHKGGWDPDLLALFGVPEAILPEVVPSSHAFGVAGAFGGGVPVASLVGDQQAALFGSHCFASGQAKNTYGTGCFLLQHTGTKAVSSTHGLLTTRAASTGKAAQFALEGAVFTGGAAVQWLRDGLGIIPTAAAVDKLAAKVRDSGGVVVVPAFTGLGAPYWDPEARGTILGITRGTDRRHVARAVLDSIAFQSAELVASMEKDSGKRIPELRVDGGAAKSAPLLQTQADLLQRPVVRPANVETTAMGAGMLAGLATDVWNAQDLKAATEGEVKFSPRMKADEATRRMQVWHQAVTAARMFRPSTTP